MISRYEVWLNNTALSEVAPSVYISDIAYQAASLSRSTGRLAARDGQFSGNKEYFPESKVSISFSVREYDTELRQRVAQDVVLWASKGGWLNTSDRQGLRMYVKPTRLPAVFSALKWTDTLTVEFTAFDYPFWEEVKPTTVELDPGGFEQVFLHGVHSAYMCAEITAKAKLTTVTIGCAGTKIVLSGITVNSGEKIVISYTDEHHILEINNVVTDSSTGKVTETSLLDKRTAGSNDDLIAKVGWNDVYFQSNASATCVLSVRGVYV